MYTRCPHCETLFRVTPQQLQVSSGQVRCGRCEQVFDAFSTLSSRLSASQDTGVDADSALTTGQQESTRELALPADYAFEAELSDEPGERPAPAVAFPTTAEGTRPSGDSDSVAPQAAEPDLLTLPDELFKGAVTLRRRWPWLLACLLAAFALGAQAAWLFPTALSQRLPALRPALAWYCDQLGCTLALPRLPDQLFIEASDLRLLDPRRPSEVLLTATIRNRAGVEQAFPMLELTLTDAVNQTAARKVFGPVEYLGKEGGPRQGIGPGQEVSIRLYLETGDIKPVGYRLYLFFA
jgi:predicted Zn finger-like uncharacterized protein